MLKLYPDFEIHCFETSVEFSKFFDGLNVTLHKTAVWIYDGVIEFYTAEDSYSGTLYKDKTTGKIKFDDTVEVDCIDLSNWIKSNFKLEDYIILKLNIEGAEYSILEKMIKDCSIEYINELYCQFHHEKIPSISRRYHNKLIKIIKKKNRKFYFWINPYRGLRDKIPIKKDRSKIGNFLGKYKRKLLKLIAK